VNAEGASVQLQLRQSNIAQLSQGVYDALVIGGGINGAVAAASLSGKGAKVALIEQRDFAGFTSQHSSNLAWGGIKYLENYEFRLVWDLCKSRNQLLKNYPTVVRELRFLTTAARGFRHHPGKLWLGAWLYWAMGRGFTRVPRFLSPRALKAEEPSINTNDSLGGIEYSDAYLYDNDARFVFGLVRSAMSHGCIAANYVESLGAKKSNDGLWQTRARDVINGEEHGIRSRTLINAAGPFVDQHNALTQQKTEHHHVFSKGIHLIVDRITDSARALAFFAEDGRLFFAIPMGHRTCIGTTDTRVDTPHTEVSDADRTFVLDNINVRLDLKAPLTKKDIIAERCGVRPLAVGRNAQPIADFLQLSRKHVIECDERSKHISIFGGKLADCINVGEEIAGKVQRLGIAIPQPEGKWYGEPSAEVEESFRLQAKRMNLDGYTSPTACERLSARLWRRYGEDSLAILEAIREDPRQTEVLIEGTAYIRCELFHAARKEMIAKLEDFLRRRSRIALLNRPQDIKSARGLKEACDILFGDQGQERFEEYFEKA
jgi:glycerol-3-phosphate dehydrogenase